MAQINKPDEYFNTKLWTGDDTTSRAISGVGFQPDLTWIKGRSLSVSHLLQDAVRGTGGSYTLKSDATAGDGTNTQGNVSAFSADGFTVAEGSDVDHTRAVNNGSETYVSWNWLGANGTASNTDGSITSTVSANTTNGFSIVSYTGNNTAGATVGHGLSQEPDVMIFKNRSDGTTSWCVYHSAKGTSGTGRLNTTDSFGDTTFITTTPSSSVFTLTNATIVNGSGNNMIAYCFAEKKGFSKFGSYTGNGNADGTFIYTGFKPAWVMLKRTDASGERWNIKDNKRNGFNQTDPVLTAEADFAERDDAQLDLLSSGFKIRTSAVSTNASGGTYIYMAFAESPLVGTNNIPATAR